MSNTPQGGAIEGNAADDALMVDQGDLWSLSWLLIHGKQVCQVVLILRSVFGYPSGRKPSAPHQLEGIFESYLRLMVS
jgi:hypothetical protein